MPARTLRSAAEQTERRAEPVPEGSTVPRRVLVTGAASGLGRATATLFAERGAEVALVDLDRARLEAVAESLPRPGSHLCLPMDVSDRTAVETGFGRVAEAWGQIDVAVLAAGIIDYDADGWLGDVSDQTWDRMVAVNLTGTFLTAQAAFDVIAKRPSSSIITVASLAALIGQRRLYAYSASKGGVVAFSRALAVEAGRSGVRVNCVCPGVVRTPMTEDKLQGAPPANALRRAGEPEEIAAAVYGFCEPGASFLTGATIPVDGGATFA